jgi:AmpD protein
MSSLVLDHHGWLKPHPGVRIEASPNRDLRPGAEAPYLLVIHHISLPPNQFGGPEVADLFMNRLDYSAHPWLEQLRGLHVSAHFFIRRDGKVIQFVPTTQRAWHAGVSSFEGRERCNDFSIGIELEGTGSLPYTDAQYETLASLNTALCVRHPLRAVLGHEHIAPGRKTDPGPSFDWLRFGLETGWPRRLMPALS